MLKTIPIAGVLNYLKETFTHTPSYDMSPAMLTVLVKMMLAQAQESMFEKVCLPGLQNEFFLLVKVAQEAAKVSLAVAPTFGASGVCWCGPTGGSRGFPRQLAHDLGSMPALAGQSAGLHFVGKSVFQIRITDSICS